jgi:hypothetical protein
VLLADFIAPEERSNSFAPGVMRGLRSGGSIHRLSRSKAKSPLIRAYEPDKPLDRKNNKSPTFGAARRSARV